MIKAYLKYKIKAVNEHKIHSPFVFEFYNEVVKKSKDVEDTAIQKIRKKLATDNRGIEVTDLGQGSRKSTQNIRRISEITKVQAVAQKYGKLLSKIIEHNKKIKIISTLKINYLVFSTYSISNRI